jgi:NADH dehydrogenase
LILVTGGTGTLGRELVRRLVETGERVRVMTRDRARARVLPSAVDIVEGDLGDDASVTAAMRGCEAVISAAHGFVGPGKPTPERVDQEGNRRLIRAAVEAKAGRFVLVSVVGAGPDNPMSLSRAKFAAERELRESGLSFTIVRAAPFMETWLMLLGDMLDTKGHVVVFGPGTNPISFVSVRDVAALVVAACRENTNDVYDIGGPENIGLAAVAQRVLEARGRKAETKHVPLFALRAMSVAARPFSPAFARQVEAAVLMNTTDMTVDATWRARHPSIPVTTLAHLLRAADPRNLS